MKIELLTLLLTLCFCLPVYTQSAPAPKVPALARDNAGLALRGYDPVAYFTTGQAIPGDPSLSLQHEGVTFRFSKAAHRDLFAANPAQYLPQFGGYCAWAVGHAYTAPSDPQAWKIVNGKLYLNYNKEVQKKWAADEKNLIEKGMRNWPLLHQSK